jgi:hypothetical protein
VRSTWETLAKEQQKISQKIASHTEVHYMEPVWLETRAHEPWTPKYGGRLNALKAEPLQELPMIQSALAPGRRVVHGLPSLRCAIAQPANPGILVELGKPEDVFEHLPIASAFDEEGMEANYRASFPTADLVAARVKRRIVVPASGKTTHAQTHKTPGQDL